jgi:uncharacterized protein YigE (DUF2233 family)
MKHLKLSVFLLLSALFCTVACWSSVHQNTDDSQYISYVVDPKTAEIKMYLKDTKGNTFGSLGNLNSYLTGQHKKLLLAMNGGMYMENRSPLGLYIENGEMKSRLNTSSGSGNFYLKPNGVFYILKDHTARITATGAFRLAANIQYATQSGPLLLVDGKIHSSFKKGSPNLNIRNGVGILPDGRVVFAMSKAGVSFYEFAEYFKNLGCKDALYLDGFVSRTYCPEKNWMQTDGNFGVIIGVTEK